MIVGHLTRYLKGQGVDFEILSHEPTYTAQQTAHAAHLPGWELAKAVIVREGHLLSMVVLPAPAKIDFIRLRQHLGVHTAELATESQFMDLFPDCEIGAMPPFGNLYGMKTYADIWLAEDEFIAFNAGSHTELIRMRYDDWETLVEPELLNLSQMQTA